MKLKYLLPAVLIVGLGVGFTGGYYFKGYNQQNQLSQMRDGVGQRIGMTNANGTTPRAGMPSGIANGQQRGAPGGFGSTEGEIISIDEKSVTVKLSDGSSKIILLSTSTEFSNFEEAKKEDLKSGIKISVFGKSNTDGSLTADRIQLNYD